MVEEALAESEKALKAYQESLGAEQKRNRSVYARKMTYGMYVMSPLPLVSRTSFIDSSFVIPKKEHT